MRAALVALLLWFALPARADIVWDGRTVTAWPEGGYDERDPSHAARFYPAPKGEVWGLTILVDFSDQAPAFTKTQVEAWLNERNFTGGGLNGSVRDYFFDVSNGMVDLRNDVVGFYRAQRTKAYYEGGSGYARAEELFREVVAALDPMVDFAKYDNDGDGDTDAINIVYAGPSVKWGQGLWPHASNSSQRADGVTLSRHMMTSMGDRLALYTFCHETGHMLFGWPDLYGFGDYCLMGNATNAQNPSGINDFFRADQGWIPEVELTSDVNVRATAKVGEGGFRYTNPDDPGECFFWSNVQNRGRWRGLKGSGLLFFHYKRSIRTNNPPNPLALAVVQADGRDDLGKVMWPSPGSDAKDFFFGGGVDELSDTTTPSARWRNGTNSGLRVHDIDPSGDVMRFSVGKKPPTSDLDPPDAGMTIEDAGITLDASVIVPAPPSDSGVIADASAMQPLDASAASPRDAAVPRRDASVREERGDDEGCALHTHGDASWLALLLVLRRRKRA